MHISFDKAYWKPYSEDVETPSAIFGVEIDGLPIFWNENEWEKSDNQQRRVRDVLERQQSFIRALGSLGEQGQFELRIVCNPNDPQFLRLFYLISVEETGNPETVWSKFHSAFPYDLDFRLRILPRDEVQRVCTTPFGRQQPLSHYEWHQIPITVQLGNETANLWIPPALRPDGWLTLLRTLAQDPHPIIIGFTVAPAETDERISAILEHWKKLLIKVETIQRYIQTRGGEGELAKKYNNPLIGEVISDVLQNFDPRIRSILETAVQQRLTEGFTATPPFLLEQIKTVAQRMLQSSVHFRWRVHAAIPQGEHIYAAIEHTVADELGRNAQGIASVRYACHACEVHALDDWAGNNMRYIRLDTPLSEEDDPAQFIIDEIGATALLQLPILPPGGIPGIRSYPANPFTSWQLEEDTSATGIEIGEYIDSRVSMLHGRQRGVFISLNDLTRHALITGSTGSGKSTTSKRILAELHQRNVPFMVIEPVKAEYGDLAFIEAITNKPPYPRFFEPGSVDDPIWFNPFYIRKGVSLNNHLSYLTSCFMAAFPLYDLQAMVLKRVLLVAYREKFAGKSFFVNEATPILDHLDDKDVPSLDDLIKVAEEEIERIGYKSDFKDDLKAAIKLRLQHLSEGVVGKALRTDTNSPSFEYRLEQLLQQPVVIQLNQIGNKEEKALLMAFILMSMYEYYEQQPESETLRHVTLIEEAHVLLENISRAQHEDAANPRGKAIELFADMLAEIRSRGEGLIIVEQLPSKLIPEAIKNSNLKIMHRLTALEDRNILGAAMNFNEWQSRFATTLQRGQAIVFREGLSQPALIRINPVQSWGKVRIEVDKALANLRRDEEGMLIWPLEILDLFKRFRSNQQQWNYYDKHALLTVTGEYLAATSNQIQPDDRQAALWFLYKLTRPFPLYRQAFHELIRD